MLRLETHHQDVVHDACLDYYGRRLATCSSDRTVKIFNVRRNEMVLGAELTSHQGPVWSVKFAHPRFGNVLASCSYDGTVLVHRENPTTLQWEMVYSHAAPASVEAIDFAPNEYGLILACVGSDGTVTVLSHDSSDDRWHAKSFQDNRLGSTSISFAPFGALGSVEQGGGDRAVLRLAVGGSDGAIRIHMLNPATQEWNCEHVLKAHSDAVKDVAWAPSVGLPLNTLASCSEDGSALIWTQNRSPGEWTSSMLHDFKPTACHRVSWSTTGYLLAISSGDNDVSVWKQNVNEKWERVSDVKQEPQAAPEQQQQQQQLDPLNGSLNDQQQLHHHPEDQQQQYSPSHAISQGQPYAAAPPSPRGLQQQQTVPLQPPPPQQQQQPYGGDFSHHHQQQQQPPAPQPLQQAHGNVYDDFAGYPPQASGYGGGDYAPSDYAQQPQISPQNQQLQQPPPQQQYWDPNQPQQQQQWYGGGYAQQPQVDPQAYYQQQQAPSQWGPPQPSSQQQYYHQ